MEKINVVVVGYGNVGKLAVEAVLASGDMNLAGVIIREKDNIPEELKNIKVVNNINDLENIQVAILCTPSRSVEENAKKYLGIGINTVDSFDIHNSIWDLKESLSKVAKENNVVSIISAGWDPGSDSIVRALLEACAPKGITHTNFGEGMSMGHSVAAKSVEGVKDALSVTIPLGTGIHRRIVYVVIEDNFNFKEISKKIKEDSYFLKDETHVIEVSNIEKLKDVGHGVNMVRKGVSGKTNNQNFEFNMKINNPALTSQILISCARATLKQNPGSYTMIEIPVIDFLEGSKEDLIKRLV